MAKGRKTGGRVAGTPNRNKTEVGAVCLAMVADAGYRKQFLARFKAGTLPAPLEAMVWHYAHGKPIEILVGPGPGGEHLHAVYGWDT